MDVYPRLIFTYEKKMPELTYWFLNIDNRIRLLSDAIRTPEIYISSKGVEIKGEWIYKSGKSVIRKEGKREDRTDHSNSNAIGFVYVDDIVKTIESKGKFFIYDDEKYSNYVHDYAFSVLENKSKILIIVNGKEIEEEKPINYRITPAFINLVYNDKSIVINIDGKRESFNKGMYYLGESTKGKIFQTLSGKILAERDPNLVGICSSDTYYLGEASEGIVIICGKQVKYHREGAWTELSSVINERASYANFNFVVVTNTDTMVYNGHFEKIFELSNIHAAIADKKYLYFLTESKRIYVVDATQTSAPFTILKDSAGFTLTIERALYPFLRLGKGLIEVKEKEEQDKITLRIEPTKLSVPTKSKIEIISDLIKYSKEISIPQSDVELDMINSYISVSEGGRVKGTEGNYNAILKARVKYNIPTKLPVTLKFKIRGKEYSYSLDKTEDDTVFNVPLFKQDTKDEIVVISLERNNYIEISREYTVKTKEVIKDPQDYKTLEVINNVSRRIVKKSEREDFEWAKISEFQEIYDNVIIAKAGNIVVIEGQKYEVKDGLQKITVSREDEKEIYNREYILYGLSDPIENIKAKIAINKLYLLIKLKYKIPITVIYGTQIKTNSNGKFVFSLDPFYSKIIVKAYYSNDIKWEHTFIIKNIMKEAILHALILSTKLKEQLDEFATFNE